MSAALKTSADARAMHMAKFPPEFNQKVDMSKVNLPVIKKWVSDEITRILNSDDDVVTEMIFTILEDTKFPNIKKLQTDLAGFLDKDAPVFCLALWKLCLSAQANNGIPKELLEAKKSELIQEQMAEERARDEEKLRRIAEREREQELSRIREREHEQRSRGGRGGRGRGRHRSPDHRSMSRDSRSPPRRGGRSDVDSYVPGGGRGGRAGRWEHSSHRRRPSPSYGRSRSPSRSPPRQRRRHDTSSQELSQSPTPREKASPDGRRNRSRSPRDRRFRRSPSYDDHRSPQNRRHRRTSPYRSRSPPRRRRRYDDSSRSHSPPAKRRSKQSSDDLMKEQKRRNEHRLSREDSLDSHHSSNQPADGGAKDEVSNVAE